MAGLTDPEHPLRDPAPLPQRPTTPPPPSALAGGGTISPAGGDLPGPQRRAVSGRAAGVSTRTRWRRCASLWRTAWSPITRAAGTLTPAQPVHAGVRHESLPVRLVRPSLRPLHLHGQRGAEVPAPHLRPAAGPDRHARGGAVRGVRGHAPQRSSRRPLPQVRSAGERRPSSVQQRRYEGTGVHLQRLYDAPPMIGQYCRLDAAGREADAAGL